MENITKPPLKSFSKSCLKTSVLNMPVIPDQNNTKPLQAAKKVLQNSAKPIQKRHMYLDSVIEKTEPLTAKRALELLLKGELKSSVCRYCLHISKPLSQLDQIMQIANGGALYKVTIRDMVASLHPFKVTDDPNFPDKICENCVNQATRSYLFAQRCDQAERALRNYIDDMYDKIEKLDPIEQTKKRGRQKLNPNYNTLYSEHHRVIDYAEPIYNLINTDSEMLTNESEMSELECKKCWQVLPNVESLVNHEKLHPKTMWYHCRPCGRSFAKQYQMKRHLRSNHNKLKLPKPINTDVFQCTDCGYTCQDYKTHLQHIEKHKFKMLLEHFMDRKMEKLCAVCLEKGLGLVDMEKMVCLHGGCPELMGDRTMFNIVGATVPEMNFTYNYTGSKICSKCFDSAISSYVFITRIHYVRNRLNACLNQMLDTLNKVVEPEAKLFIEISENVIMPPSLDYDENILLDEADDVDETKLKVDVLEDEFRLQSESESESEIEDTKNDKNVFDSVNNVAKKTYKPKQFVNTKINGYNNTLDVCSEFLTFKKKNVRSGKVKTKFDCPICSKRFISEYFWKKHILKHANVKMECKICWKQFPSKFNLHEHLKMVHFMNQNSYSCCTICGRCFRSEQKMLQHEKCHQLVECQLCDKIFVSQQHYNSHLQKHAFKFTMQKLKNVQTCSFCEIECSNDNELSVHVNKTHLQIKPYNCDMCDRQFYTEFNLKHHKQLHSLRSIERCEFCSKTLKCRRDLVIHVRKHIGSKPFKCLVCSEVFYSDLKVRNHMRKIHGGVHCCKLCRSVFVSKQGLKVHVTVAHSVF